MKKEVMTALILVFILLFSNFVSAYSFTARAVDDVRMFFSGDEGKVDIALEVREKQLDEAIEKAKAGDTEGAIKILEDAKEKLEVVQEKTSSDSADKVMTNIEEITEKIMQSKDINPEFTSYLEEYLTEEQKTQLSAELSDRLFAYCDELAKQDYELMLSDEKCNPENAPDWLGKKVKENLEESQEESAEKMLEIFTTCINNPRECDCSEIPIASEKNKCEKGKTLAIKCEFQKDESACRELDEMDIEIPSNIPKFLRPLFQQKINNAIKNKEKEMFDEFAPPECVEAGAKTREECEAVMMEKYAPKECIEADATTKEECEKIMFAIHGAPPNECMENGEFIGPEACNEKMVSSGMIPEECVKNGKPIPEDECRAIMMKKGGMPEECGDLSEEECRKLMEEKGMKEMPPECEGLSPEECRKLMEEKGMEYMKPDEEYSLRPDTEGKRIPQECVGMTFEECENYLMGKHMPQECVDAEALTPEDCKRIMLPGECKQAGALNREECETIMIKKQMPQECQETGALSPDKCAKLMSKNIVVGGTPGSEMDYLNKKGISFDEIPSVCVSGSNFIRSMECDEALAGMGITLPPPSDTSNIPPECVKDGVPVSPQECQGILQGKLVNENIPGPCREAGINDQDECGRFMEKEKRKEGMGMMDLPEECFGMSVLECKQFMDEHGMKKIDVAGIMKKMGKADQMPKEGEEPEEEFEKPVRVPMECIEMGITDESACEIVMSKINEERIKRGDKMIVDDEGNEDYISNDEINKIVEEAERTIDEFEPDLDLVNEIKEEVEIIEDNIVELEERSVEIEEHEESPEPEVSGGGESEPASESSSGGEGGGESGGESSGGESGGEPAPTGEAIREIEQSDNFLARFWKRIFGN